jgi:hypothetical protein
MKKIVFHILFIFISLSCFSQQFRPPSVPLVAHDPYFSIWSPADRLYDRETVHWTGKEHPLHSIIRIDGKAFRLMGSQPSSLEPVKQTKVTVLPTRTVYQFKNDQVNVELMFTTPALVSDLDILSRPITYLTWKVKSVDGRSHDVQLYFDCSGEIAVNTSDQDLQWNSPKIEGLKTLRMGSLEQPVLQKRGDNLRIDWGYAYLSAVDDQKTQIQAGSRKSLFHNFISTGNLKQISELGQPRKSMDEKPSMAVAWNMGKINSSEATCWAMLGYDDLYAVKYFNANLQAWWKRKGMYTKDGPKVIEFNARFGDPEAMNVLSIVSSSFTEICEGIANGNLSSGKVSFQRKATVCKYVVPKGYGTEPVAGAEIKVNEKAIARQGCRSYFAMVNEEDGKVLTTSSRALGVVGIDDTIEAAEKACEKALAYVTGDAIFVRHDIGKPEIIKKRVEHMQQIRKT